MLGPFLIGATIIGILFLLLAMRVPRTITWLVFTYLVFSIGYAVFSNDDDLRFVRCISPIITLIPISITAVSWWLVRQKYVSVFPSTTVRIGLPLSIAVLGAVATLGFAYAAYRVDFAAHMTNREGDWFRALHVFPLLYFPATIAWVLSGLYFFISIARLGR